MAVDLGTLYWKVDADTSQLAKARAEMRGVGDSADKAGKQADGMGKRTEAAGKKSAKGFSVANIAANKLKGTITALIAGGAIRGVVSYADAWQNTTNQLKTVQRESESLVQTQEKLLGLANQTRAGYESTTQLYTRLSRATENLNLNQNDLLGITQTINQAFAVSGATATEASAAITQLSQGLAAGALRGEEFNSVAEQAPILMDALGDALNMTRGELRDFAAEGGITAEIVVDALQQSAEEIDASFSKMTATFGQNMQIAQNNMLEFVGASEEVGVVVNGLGGALVGLSENLDVLVDVVQVLTVALGVRLTASLIKSTAATVAATSAATAYASAQALVSRGVAAFGGPAGLAVVAAFSVWQLVDAFRGTEESAEGAAKGVSILREAVQGFSESNGDAQAIARQLEYEIEQTATALNTAVAVYGAGSEAVREMTERLDSLREKLNQHNQAAQESAEAEASYTEESKKVISALERRLEVLGMTADQEEITSELIRAGVDANSAAGKEIIALVEAIIAKTAAQEAAAEAEEDAKKAAEDAAKAARQQRLDTVELIQELENEGRSLRMTGREQALFNAQLQALAVGAGPAATQRIIELTLANYDYNASLVESEKLERERAKAAEEAARQAERNWERTHEFVTERILDIAENGGSAFERLGDIAADTAKRIIAEFAAVQALEFFGISAPSAGGSVGGSLLGGLGKSALGGLGGSVGQFIGGLTGSAVGAGSSLVGPPTAAAAAGAGIAGSVGAFLTNPLTLGVGGLALAAGLLNNDDGYKRSYAGLVTAPTPGAAGLTFDIDPFASGFAPQGVAHRATREQALQQIAPYRAIDAEITRLTRQLGGNIDLSRATLSGVGAEGQFGTAGTFLGQGGMTTQADQLAMMNQFASELVDHISGLDDELMKAVESAETADEAIRLLSEALGEQAEVLTPMEEAQKKAVDQIVQAYESGLNELDAVQLAYAEFQQFADRGLTAASIANFTDFMESEIQSVLDRGASMAQQADAISSMSDRRNQSSVSAGFFDFDNYATIMERTLGIDGSHATGKRRVPYDGYLAQLHEGERVQTATEARMDDMETTLMKSMQLNAQKTLDDVYVILRNWNLNGLPPERASI